MKLWIVYCFNKEQQLIALKNRTGISFTDTIGKIESFNYIIVESKSTDHVNQQSFIIKLKGYPFVVPFNIRGSVIQLITVFSDRRFKNVRF